eukprot:PhM_4_TR2456/c3_g1_i5/m.64715
MDNINYKQLKDIKFCLDKTEAKEAHIKDILQSAKNEYAIENLHKRFLINFLKSANKCDTANLNYTQDSEKVNNIPILTNIYSDNALLVCLVPIHEINNNTISKHLITFYRQKLLLFFTEKGINITSKELGLKGLRLVDGIGFHLKLNDAETINSVYKKFNLNHIPQHERAIKGQYIKIELHENNIDSVLNCFTDENIKELNKDLIFFGDIDYTQDLGCNFNKEELIKHLTQNYAFKLQNTNINKEENKEENQEENQEENKQDQEETYIEDSYILDNNNSVGKNCLTFITDINGIKARFKIYNKFISWHRAVLWTSTGACT